ncbi:MAG: DegQ family serine endoprotease [Parvibaculales bacterium]
MIGHFNLTALVLAFVVFVLPASSRPMPNGFADLAESLVPSVVNISTTATVQRSAGPGQPPFNDFFEEFFRDRRMPQRKHKVSSLGSGFVIDPNGIIITNNHVIEEADEITVNFSDGSKYEAKILGRDPKTDIAVLKVEAKKPLPFVPMGDSKKVRVGDWAIAIGNPFGLGGSLSAGIISAVNRDINSGPYDSFIQTDAAINRGNSGGPLFNMDGEVIGVNSAIISPSGGSVGIGFAIPSNLASNIIGQLQKYGETRRGWLGVRIQQVTDELAGNLGLDKPHGALVSEISPDSPAEKGGLKVGDVIVRFDGKKVPHMRDLPRIVADTEVDTEVLVEVMRRGKKRKLRIVTGRLDEPNLVRTGNDNQQQSKKGNGQTILGMRLTNLDARTRSEMDLPEEMIGTLVSDVDPDDRGFENGIRRGDIIVEIAQNPTPNVAATIAAFKAAQKAKANSVLVLVNSRGSLRFVSFKLRN